MSSPSNFSPSQRFLKSVKKNKERGEKVKKYQEEKEREREHQSHRVVTTFFLAATEAFLLIQWRRRRVPEEEIRGNQWRWLRRQGRHEAWIGRLGAKLKDAGVTRRRRSS